MSATAVVPREQVREEVAGLLARALGRLTAAEAEGRLTPAEARVVAQIRAEMAASTAVAPLAAAA